MALIGKIRNNPFLILIFIGGGIALFVLSDIMNSGNNGPVGPVEAVMGRVGEREIERNDFERTLTTAFNGGDAYRNRAALWDFYVNEGLIENEAEQLGLTVSQTELEDLTFGNNPSPVIRQNFTNPQTGQLDRQVLDNIRNYIDNDNIDQAIQDRQLNENFRSIWKYQQRQVGANRLQEKLAAAVTKAMYAPTWLAQDFANEQIQSRDVAVVRIPYDELGNDEVEVTTADMEAYIKDNRSLYEAPEETRKLAYVAFEIAPSEQDMSDLRATLNEIKTEWATAASDSLFALSRGGSYSGLYQSRDRVSPAVADAVFGQLEVGDIYGPYQEGNAMKLAKLIDRVEMPDSADTRHILVNAATPQEFEEAEALVDSLRGVLQRSPSKWEELAAEFSDDPGSKDKGGEYENVTPGQFVRPFDEILFRTGREGELYSVRTSFGVHLVEILDRSAATSTRAQVAYAVENIEPSRDTDEQFDVRSQEFLSGVSNLDELKAAAAEAGMEVNTTRPLPMSAFEIIDLGSGQEVRDMMCWAFSADEGEVSDVIYTFDDPALFYRRYYVVVGLEKVIPEGLMAAEDVEDQVRPSVVNRKKAEKIKEAVAGMDLRAAAARYNSEIDTLRSVNPSLTTLPGVGGREPAVLGAIATAPTGRVSEPIVGNIGVYLLYPLTDAPTGTSGSVPGARTTLNSQARNGAGQLLLAGMRAGADIEDTRGIVECTN